MSSTPTFLGKPVLVEYGAVHHPALFDLQLGALLRRDEADGATEDELMPGIAELAERFGLAVHVTITLADAILLRVRSGGPEPEPPPALHERDPELDRLA